MRAISFSSACIKNIERIAFEPMARSYKQFCMLAKALDLVGERWTLLIVRDLLMGPKRFKDLLAGLPGIGTNLLSARLKRLAGAGVVEQVKLPAPASVSAWALTELGERLEESVLALSAWGRTFMQQHEAGELRRPSWLFLALRRFYNAAAIADLRATLVFEIDGEVLFLTCQDGALTTGEGRPVADATIVASRDAVGAMVFGKYSARAAIDAGVAEIQGDLDIVDACLAAFQT